MEALEAIARRRSVREFTGVPVPRRHLEAIVNAGRMAATGYNRQPWTFVVITDPDMLCQASLGKAWVQRAGALIAVVLDPSAPFWREDGCAAVENMLIAATALGYGSCWLEGATRPHEADLKRLLGVPEELRLATLVAVGVASEWPTRAKRELHEVLRWERYE